MSIGPACFVAISAFCLAAESISRRRCEFWSTSCRRREMRRSGGRPQTAFAKAANCRRRSRNALSLRRRRARGASAGERGFTLVEMLVVITIIGLIMALVGPRVLNYLGESKAKAAKIQIESFSSALDLYYLDLGRYPTSNEGLAALTQGNNA